MNAKANVSRSRDCNLEGVPTEVNHSHLIPQGPPPPEKLLPTSTMGARGRGQGVGQRGVWGGGWSPDLLRQKVRMDPSSKTL